MDTQYALLGFLAEGPNYGYELKKTYDNLFGNHKKILTGQIYSTLFRLKRDQKITDMPVAEKSSGPERVRYAITPTGKQDLQRWLESPEAPSAQLQAAIYMKTVLAIMQGGDAAPYLDKQRRAHIQHMRQLTSQRRTAPLAAKLRIDHALFHVEADLRWIDLTSSRLMKLKEELCQ